MEKILNFIKYAISQLPTYKELELAIVSAPPSAPPKTAKAYRQAGKKNEDSEAVNDDRFEGIKTGKATGKVILAEENTVGTFGRGKAYKTFTVVLKTTSGEVGFSGVDLQKQFDNGAFSVGDTVTIEKETIDFFVEIKGEKRKRSKNSFKITVLKKGRY